MPVNPNLPEPLKEALERMEQLVQSFKSSLPFTAPEVVDQRYITLQNGLAATIFELYDAAKE